MRRLLYLFLIATGIACWSGCADEPIQLNGNLYTSLSEVYDQIAPPIQTFTLNANTGGMITAQKGTTIEFPPNAFIDPMGNMVSGNVTVTIIEVLTEADMITSGIYPVNTNGDMLSSGGEIYINVTQDGMRLSMAYGQYYELNIPANGNTTNMGVYEGIGASVDSFWSYVEPTLDSIPVGLTGYRDTSACDLESDTYQVISYILGWVNCDAFPEIPFVDCNIHFSGAEDLLAGSTDVIFIADMYMLAAYMAEFTYDTPSNTAIDCHVPATSGYILVTTIKMGNLYFGITPLLTPADGATYELTLNIGTPGDLAAALDAL